LVRGVVAVVRELGLPELYLITPDQQRLYASLGWQARQQVSYRGEMVTLMAIAP
jgi:N-acetylglutamate synthase-like GNAT family acetyltransferase